MGTEQVVRDRDNAIRAVVKAPLAMEGPTVPGSIIPPGSPRVDLRSAASGAAIELDNISLKRKFKTASIRSLVDLLSAGVPAVEQRTSPMSLITPTVIVMDRVVRNKTPGAQLDDVINDIESILDGLRRVISQPAGVQEELPELVLKLRSDCLDISRFAASLRRPTVPGPRSNSRS